MYDYTFGVVIFELIQTFSYFIIHNPVVPYKKSHLAYYALSIAKKYGYTWTRSTSTNMRCAPSWHKYGNKIHRAQLQKCLSAASSTLTHSWSGDSQHGGRMATARSINYASWVTAPRLGQKPQASWKICPCITRTTTECVTHIMLSRNYLLKKSQNYNAI
jgi:hypothetical protein